MSPNVGRVRRGGAAKKFPEFPAGTDH